MGELNNKTIEISNKIKNAGYDLIEMYECEWIKMLINARYTIKKLENKQYKLFKHNFATVLIPSFFIILFLSNFIPYASLKNLTYSFFCCSVNPFGQPLASVFNL